MSETRILPALVLLAALGCAKADPHAREPLTGEVRFRGRPIPHANIRFTDVSGKHDFDTGALITNGRYEIPREFGVPPGRYRAQISLQEWKGANARPAVAGAEGEGEMRQVIPAPFSTEGVVVEVVAGRPNTFDFDIP